MRIIGRRREPLPGLRWPTEDEIRRTHEFARDAYVYHPKGVIRYRNHEEANAHMREMLAEALARKAAKLLR